jgi:hypothetical protein
MDWLKEILSWPIEWSHIHTVKFCQIRRTCYARYLDSYFILHACPLAAREFSQELQ